MPGLALRDFQCSLCRAHFEMFAADLILPGPNVCDDCLTAVWELDDEALARYVLNHLGARSQEQTWVDAVVRHIKWYKEQSVTAEDAIRSRRWML
jgi:hypothetical protein